MNSQWMTTFFSQFKQELASRGVRLSSADLAALLEEVVPSASRSALGGALDYLRPFTAGLGFRVARLSDSQIELVIPWRERNRDSQGRLHEAVLVGAALEAARLLWTRHAPVGGFDIEVHSFSAEFHRHPRSEIRVRLEIPETARENVLALLRENHQASSEISLRFVDGDEQSVADMNLSLKLRHTPTLDAPAE